MHYAELSPISANQAVIQFAITFSGVQIFSLSHKHKDEIRHCVRGLSSWIYELCWENKAAACVNCITFVFMLEIDDFQNKLHFRENFKLLAWN
jgi:hypothetical protein